MGNQGKIAGNWKICIRIQSQLFFSWIHKFDAFSLRRVTYEFKKQYTKSGVQRSPWTVFRKPWFSHTFSVIRQYQNYRKYMEKLRFSKNWSWTSLHSRFSVLFFELVTKVTLFKEREHQKELAGLNFNTSLLISRHLALITHDELELLYLKRRKF